MSLVPVPRRADWIRWFVPEPPGADAMAAHMTRTGRGEVFADRWPEPRLLLLSADGDVLLRGDPAAVPASALAGRVRGFVDAPADFEPVLREVAGSVIVWQRVVQVMDGVAPPPGPAARRLRPADADALAALPVELRWIWKTWGGPAQLCGSGFAWGAFDGATVAAVACTFYVGTRHEEMGVVTPEESRRQGLSTACAAGLCADAIGRGRIPSWTTTPDNLGSLGVARRLGFRHVRDDLLYLVDIGEPD